jgi:hypothetical protein
LRFNFSSPQNKLAPSTYYSGSDDEGKETPFRHAGFGSSTRLSKKSSSIELVRKQFQEEEQIKKQRKKEEEEDLYGRWRSKGSSIVLSRNASEYNSS